jgi:exosortase
MVVPLALWFAWQRRGLLERAPHRPSFAGLVVMTAGLGLLMVGVLGAELFLSRVSLLFVLAGLVLFLGGRAKLRVLAFPLAFLLLMIPIPAILFNKIAFPLQLLASQAGAATLDLAYVPVLREGNVLVLANTKLEVAEACSGIRSLVTLLTLAIVLGQFSLDRAWSRVALVLAAVPVAIAANAARVAGTGLAAHFWSPEAAEGFFHAFSGWAMFGVAFAILLAIQRGLGIAEARWGNRAPMANGEFGMVNGTIAEL